MSNTRNPKQSSPKEASIAGKTLANPNASPRDKSLAGSVLSQAQPKNSGKGK